MADNVQITEGVGTFIISDEIAPNEKIQVVKIGLGADGALDNFVDAGEQAEAVSIPVIPAVDAVAFEAMQTVAFGSVGGSYAAALTPGSSIIEIEINNDTDAAIVVSFDAGTTDHWRIPFKEARIFTFRNNFRNQSAAIHIKHEGVAPTEGNVYLMAQI
jgi:hypothetical protein